MNIVNGFDIDTPEGAKAYLESEGINAEQCIEDGRKAIARIKALCVATVTAECPRCKGSGFDPYDSGLGIHATCPECRGN
jgi:predicted Zn-ribbon and HTH transcriptional regulator